MAFDYLWRPRFVYGVGGDVIDLRMSLPIRPWEVETATVGGARTAAGGVPASHVVRTDYLISLVLRLRESDVPAVARLIAWGQSAESFLWYPDRTGTTSHGVYLEHPAAGESWRPRRDSEYPRLLELDIVLRRTAVQPWDLDFFPTC